MLKYNLTFEDALRMDFPQPRNVQVGQEWFDLRPDYDLNTTNRIVITNFSISDDDDAPNRVYFTYYNDIGTRTLKIEEFLNKFIYCPTVEDILGQLPDYNLTCYILNGKRRFELKTSKTVMIDGSSFPKRYSQPTAIGVCVEAYLSIKHRLGEDSFVY